MQIAVVLSVILGFLSSEFLGLASGGLISAGYLSLYVTSPWRIVATLVLAVLIHFLVKLLDQFVFLYGRRRFMACILLSVVLSWVLTRFIGSYISVDLRIIGYLIPGLIANDMQRQGVLKTLLVVMIITVLVFMSCLGIGSV